MAQDSERTLFAARLQDGSIGVVCAISSGILYPYCCYSLTRGPLSTISAVKLRQPQEVKVDDVTASVTIKDITIGYTQNWHTKAPLGFVLLSPDMLKKHMPLGTLCIGINFKYIVYDRFDWGGPHETACVWYLSDSVFYPQAVRTHTPVLRGEQSVAPELTVLGVPYDAVTGVVGAADRGYFAQPVDRQSQVQPLLWLGRKDYNEEITKIEAVVAVNEAQGRRLERSYRIYVERWSSTLRDKLGHYNMTAMFYISDKRLRFRIYGCSYTAIAGNQQSTQFQPVEKQIQWLYGPYEIPEQLSPQAAASALMGGVTIEDVQQAVREYRSVIFGSHTRTSESLTIANDDFELELTVSGTIQLDICMKDGSIWPCLGNTSFELSLFDPRRTVLKPPQITPL